MPEFDTISQMLEAQGERKLQKLRTGIMERIDLLAAELKMVDAAIARKQRAKAATAEGTTKNGGKASDGLPRAELLRYVREVGHPVKAAEMKDVLAKKGIIRRTEAVRNGLVRLERDGELARTKDGRFGVAGTSGDGGETEDQSLAGQVSLVEGANR
jgi:hypothetical protein